MFASGVSDVPLLLVQRRQQIVQRDIGLDERLETGQIRVHT